MAEFIANAIQQINVGSNAVFTDTVVDGCDLIVHRNGSGIIKLFPISGRCSTRFKVTFGANIANLSTVTTSEPISIALSIDGEAVPSTTATVTPPTGDEYFNVATSAYVYVRHGCCSTIGVKNISDYTINMQNANIIITRA